MYGYVRCKVGLYIGVKSWEYGFGEDVMNGVGKWCTRSAITYGLDAGVFESVVAICCCRW